jgi:hypothetical protein
MNGRRPFQFSLWTLPMIVTALAVCLGIPELAALGAVCVGIVSVPIICVRAMSDSSSKTK